MTNQTISQLAPIGLDETILYWRDGMDTATCTHVGLFELEEHARLSFAIKRTTRAMHEPFTQTFVDAMVEARARGMLGVGVFHSDLTWELIPL